MPNKYVPFVSDDHFLSCVAALHGSYINAKNDFTKKKFYKNKVDTIKLTFDSLFNDIPEEKLIESEVLRQIDKSINNSIGTFHEQILGGIEGYESGFLKGYDVKANDDTLFADIKNKHNTMNSSSAEALFQKLARYADDNKKAKCYWVQILAKGSFCELWSGDINGKEYSHSRVYKISGDQFYAMLSGIPNALHLLYQALPHAINDYISSLPKEVSVAKRSALEEIKAAATKSGKTLIDQVTEDNYPYYKGFGDKPTPLGIFTE